MRKENSKQSTCKRQSNKALEFSIADRVSFLMKARENQKTQSTPSLRKENNKIIVRKELDSNHSIPVRVIVKPDYWKEFKNFL